MRLGELKALVVDAASGWFNDRAPTMGAAIAYYTVFSIAPTVVLVIALAGFVYGEEAASGALYAELRGLMGEQSAAAVERLVESANRPQTGRVAAIVGLVTLLIGATTVFAELQSSLNVIWRAEPRKGSTWWLLLRTRLLSLSIVFVIGFLLLVSLVISAAISALGAFVNRYAGGTEAFLQAMNFVVSFGVVTVLFAMIFKLLPDRDIAWRDVWFGAAVTSMLFSIGKLGIGYYIGTSGIASSYGAAGTLIVLLVWVYYSAQILLFGAEVTRAWTERRGGKPPPAAHARSTDEGPAASR